MTEVLKSPLGKIFEFLLMKSLILINPIFHDKL